MKTIPSFTHTADPDLLDEVKRLAGDERQATAALIASLAELDARRLYLGEGYSSLFTWCTQVLHLSEHAAYGRIEVARAARRFPVVLERLAAGEVTLTAVCLLRPHLTDENHRELLDAVRHKSKREVEHLIAALRPKPDVAVIVRKLPARQAPAASHDDESPGALWSVPSPSLEPPPITPKRRPIVAPLAPERYKLQFTVGRETHDKLRRAQELLRHAVPDGDPAKIFDRALTLLVERLERTKLGRANRPRMSRPLSAASRRIPAAVRRAVWERDAGRCAFVGASGRCTERSFLELHHVFPYARGGKATVDNIQLRCRAHNQYEAVTEFGPRPLIVREWPHAYGPARQDAQSLRFVVGLDTRRLNSVRTELASARSTVTARYRSSAHA